MTTLTAEQLQQVAERLGYSALRRNRTDNGRWDCKNEHGYWFEDAYSDGDLLLALLNRAAEMGWGYTLEGNQDLVGSHWAQFEHKECDACNSNGTSQLEAVVLAFIAVPR